MKKTIGEQVAQFMADRKMKAADMAVLVGTSRQNIEGVVKHDRFPRDYIDRLAKAMEITVDQLLAGAYDGTHSQNEVTGETRMSQSVTGSKMDSPSSTERSEIPVAMPYSAPNLRSAILLMGNLLGALDARSKSIIGDMLKDLAAHTDDAEDIANKASALATVQQKIANDPKLDAAMKGRRSVETSHGELR